MQTLACPECGFGVAGTIGGKIRKHNRSGMKFDTCPASGLTADEYNAQHKPADDHEHSWQLTEKGYVRRR